MALPIDAHLDEIVRVVAGGSNVVVEAAPGAGKTTRAPAALLEVGRVVVLEPRRIAARMAARRVAEERGAEVGREVGYQVRFEDATSAETRLMFVTEGVLVRRLLEDPKLEDVAMVCLDEFHERHLETDMALAMLRRVQKTSRPDLRIVVMSATIEAGPVARFLGGCPVVRAEGRMFPVKVEHRPYSAAPLEERVAEAVRDLKDDGGGVLVFLPGVMEIERAARAVEGVARGAGMEVRLLHGRMPAEEQDRAVEPGPERKLILATNVAESSITVEGVTAVIDSGLARVAMDSPWSGLPVLKVQRVSQASARQRAGRAGRTGPGRVIRLYPEEDFRRRPAEETPEILRRELSQLCLDLAAMGVRDVGEVEWLDAPPEEALGAARELLRGLGALDGAGRLTEVGRKMATLPVHPRLARMVVEGAERGAGGGAARAAAWLAEGVSGPAANLLELVEAAMPYGVEQTARQIRRLAGIGGGAARHEDAALMEAARKAFPDRVAARAGEGLVLLEAGGQARLSGTPVPEYLVALDIEERPERGLPRIRLWCPVEVEMLIEGAVETRGIEWNTEAERVEEVRALRRGKIVLEEKRGPAPGTEETAAVLAGQAGRAALGRFVDAAVVKRLVARSRFAVAGGARALCEEDVSEVLREACRGRRSFAELAEAGGEMVAALEERAGGRRLLETLAPEFYVLPRGRKVRIQYEEGKSPSIASRLQDFFGMRETPRVGGGRLVVQLLAPNQRPVQTTADLEGFWERLYPKLRRELGRRYPKHKWPEDPLRPEE
jgi:ATP-dependent helicase HrpB